MALTVAALFRGAIPSFLNIGKENSAGFILLGLPLELEGRDL